MGQQVDTLDLMSTLIHNEIQYKTVTYKKSYYTLTHSETYRDLERLLIVTIATMITVTITTNIRNPPIPATMYPALLPDDSSLSERIQLL